MCTLRRYFLFSLPAALVVVVVMRDAAADRPMDRPSPTVTAHPGPSPRPSTPSQPQPKPSASAAPAADAGVPVGVRRPSCAQGMVRLTGGSFAMGERGDTVTLGDLCVDATEVTVDAYADCVRTGQCTSDHLGASSSDGASFVNDARCNFTAEGKGRHPINCVDWQQAAAFCTAQGKRLPTEEEWEWVARGASEARAFPWGDASPDAQVCWSGTVQRYGTCPVGSFPAGDTAAGVHDLAGNVWEWTSTPDGTGAGRVFRGGGWSDSSASILRASARFRAPASRRTVTVGFRCARPASP